MNIIKAKSRTEVGVILDELITAVKQILAQRFNKAILFGSYARGDFDNESDIDVMFLTNLPEEELSLYSKKIVEAVAEIDLKYDIVLTFILQNEDKFTKYKNDMTLYSNILREGVVLYEQKTA